MRGFVARAASSWRIIRAVYRMQAYVNEVYWLAGTGAIFPEDEDEFHTALRKGMIGRGLDDEEQIQALGMLWEGAQRAAAKRLQRGEG